MHLVSKLSVLMILMLLNSQTGAFVCFSNTKYPGQKVCYAEKHEKDLVAKKYFVELTKNISNPGKLVRLQGEMKERYTKEHFHKSFIKYYSHITPKSIEQIISHGDLSALFLKTGEVMYFSHKLHSFIFNYDPPLIFVGAKWFYGNGSGEMPAILHSQFTTSNCNLQKNGVVLLSPEKESFFFKDGKTFCTYGGFYFETTDNSITVKPVSSIGKSSFSISGLQVNFRDFIKWLKMP